MFYFKDFCDPFSKICEGYAFVSFAMYFTDLYMVYFKEFFLVCFKDFCYICLRYFLGCVSKICDGHFCFTKCLQDFKCCVSKIYSGCLSKICVHCNMLE